MVTMTTRVGVYRHVTAMERMSSGLEEEDNTDSPPGGDVPSLGREFMIFKKLFRDLRLHTDVGLKLYNAKRKEIDERFYDVFFELNLAIDLLEQHQTALAEGKNALFFESLMMHNV